MVGITAYSVYVPRYRLDRSLIARAWGTAQAPGEIAVANYDEDALTMATDAALACAPDAEAAAVDALYFASTSAPYREKQVASVIATACDVPRRAHTADFTGSVRAGISALLAGVYAVRAGARTDVLVTAADARLAAPESEIEGLLGHAAVALRIGTKAVVAEVVDAAFVSEEFTHLWRTDDQKFVQAFPGKFSNTYGYARNLGEAIRALLGAQKLKPESIAKLAVQSPDARAGRRPGKRPRLRSAAATPLTGGQHHWQRRCGRSPASPWRRHWMRRRRATGSWWAHTARGRMRCCCASPTNSRGGVPAHSWKRAVENKLAAGVVREVPEVPPGAGPRRTRRRRHQRAGVQGTEARHPSVRQPVRCLWYGAVPDGARVHQMQAERAPDGSQVAQAGHDLHLHGRSPRCQPRAPAAYGRGRPGWRWPDLSAGHRLHRKRSRHRVAADAHVPPAAGGWR